MISEDDLFKIQSFLESRGFSESDISVVLDAVRSGDMSIDEFLHAATATWDEVFGEVNQENIEEDESN